MALRSWTTASVSPKSVRREWGLTRCTSAHPSCGSCVVESAPEGAYVGADPSTAAQGGVRSWRPCVSSSPKTIRQLGMVSLLTSVPEFEVVGEAASGGEAVARASQLQPDVVLMDLQMPEVNGVEATRMILQESPSIRTQGPLFEDEDSVFMALRRRGGAGYVLKDAEEEEMVLSIPASAEAIFSPAIAEQVLAYFAGHKPSAPPQVFSSSPTASRS